MTKPREIDLEQIRLSHGMHEWTGNGELPTSQEMCIMEAVSWVAREPWSDNPKCVSGVIVQFLRTWNDNLDDESRQRLKPYITRVIDTAGTKEQEQARGLMAMDWLVRHHMPAWLDLAGHPEMALRVRSLPALDSWTTIKAAMPTLIQAKQGADAARAAAGDAAWDAAWDAAGAAAWDAAWDAARDAAGAAAWDAAWDAARDAAGAAAWDAARDAARAAARAAAGDAARAAPWPAARDAARAAAGDAARAALAPTVISLQDSALELLDAMIAVTS
jgi:hypothetical protein